MVHVLSHSGQKLSSYRAHTAPIMDIRISDDGSEFVGTASFDGPSRLQGAVILSLLLTNPATSPRQSRPQLAARP